ncbi:ANTAR domain-containing protein [Jiangella alkaliphila]|uniref:ANTAR domain-containing protein n=1 Tax=Jiangella alkaliphila TaxID=419479 RepID=A0A1H2L6P4_9ACTN|nr:ANTAR domain-containing protein [Jiangella alkaliphila]
MAGVRAPRVWRIILESIAATNGDQRNVLDALCLACSKSLPVSGVGLALMTERGHEGTVTATDESAAVMENLQETLGEGPCLDASRWARPVLESDLAAAGTTRWPVFGPAAIEAGIGAIFAFPLHVGGIRLGVLDLYRATAGSLSEDEFAEALAFSDAATTVLLHLQDKSPSEWSLHPQLDDAVESRREIHQATGMVSVQAGVNLTEALLLLRARAYASERSLAATAADVVSRRLRIGPEEGENE